MKFYKICILLTVQLFCYQIVTASEDDRNGNSADAINDAERPWLRINDKKSVQRSFYHGYSGARRDIPFGAASFFGARREAKTNQRLPYQFWGARREAKTNQRLPYQFWGARREAKINKRPYKFWGAREVEDLPITINDFWRARETKKNLPWVQRLRRNDKYVASTTSDNAEDSAGVLKGEKRRAVEVSYYDDAKKEAAIRLLKNLVKKEKIPYYDVKRNTIKAADTEGKTDKRE